MPVDYPLRRVGAMLLYDVRSGRGDQEQTIVSISCKSDKVTEGEGSNISKKNVDFIQVRSQGISARATSTIMTQAWPGRATLATQPPMPPTGATNFYAKWRQAGDDNRDCELDARASPLRL